MRAARWCLFVFARGRNRLRLRRESALTPTAIPMASKGHRYNNGKMDTARKQEAFRGALIPLKAPEPISTAFDLIEKLRNLRMPQRLATHIEQQILFRNIGDIFGLLILGQQMIIRLVFGRANFLWDRKPPLLGIGKLRIHIEDNAPKREKT